MHQLWLKILLTWRLTNLCVNEPGPHDVFDHFRDAMGIEYDEFSLCVGKNQFAQAFCCWLCASVWVGFAIALIHRENPIKGLSYSAGAILVNEVMSFGKS